MYGMFLRFYFLGLLFWSVGEMMKKYIIIFIIMVNEDGIFVRFYGDGVGGNCV